MKEVQKTTLLFSGAHTKNERKIGGEAGIQIFPRNRAGRKGEYLKQMRSEPHVGQGSAQ